MIDPVQNLKDANILALAIINTIPEPFLILDADIRVLAASRSFYDIFKVDPEHTHGRLLYELGDGQWDIPELRAKLETIIPDHVAMDAFEVEHDFPEIGHRIMLLSARKVVYADSKDITILLAFQDVTERRAIERDKETILEQSQDMVRQKQTLLDEMRHRVANSLQIIASILMLKARAVSSEETRSQLHDAHQRVLSVAVVQEHLHETDGIEQINVKTYLEKLCAGLAASMVGEAQPVAIKVTADGGMVPSAKAVSLGLIVTELVINALKHAFTTPKADAAILVTYEIDGSDWKLTVSDNGIGNTADAVGGPGSGLGTTIVKALATQLDARVETDSRSSGLSVAITHTTFSSRMPPAGLSDGSSAPAGRAA